MKVDAVTGASGLAPGVHPAAADKTNFRVLNNMVCDIPGFAIKRRGLEDITDPQSTGVIASYSTLWGNDDMRPIQAWSFDNSIFVYFENVNGLSSGIASFEMTKYLNWQIVATNDVTTNTVTQMLDGDKFKMRSKAFDRTLLINTNTGIKRIASLAHDFPADQSGVQWDYSTAYRDAGIPPAMDCRIPNVVTADNTVPGLHPTTTPGQEWLPPRSAVSFKICWVRRDENGRLVTGAPSGRTLVQNVSTTDSYAVSMLIPIPDKADERFVMQEFRTRVITEDAEGGIPDPGDDHFQSGEYRLTAADLAAGFILFEDLSFDPLLGQALYVNPGQEGPLASRSQPPMARDIENFGNCAWYSNTNEKVGLSVKFLAVNFDGSLQAGIIVGDVIVAGDLSLIAVDVADEYAQDWNFALDDTTGIGSEVVRAIKTAESFAYKYNLLSNKYGGRFWAHCATTNDDIYGVVNLIEKRFHKLDVLSTNGGTQTISNDPGTHSNVFVGVNRIDAPTQFLPSPVFTDAPSATLAQLATVDNIGTGDVILEDLVVPASWLAGDRIFLSPYANSMVLGSTIYSTTDCQPACVNSEILAGEYTITAVTGTTVTIHQTYSSTVGVDSADDVAQTGAWIHKIFDKATSTETEARSDEARNPNALFFSVPGEPEGVPRLNKLYVGSPDAGILRIQAITTSMFVFKEDGLWRIQGTDGQWIINNVDPTCRLIAPESVQTVAGRVYAYTALGVVQVTESGVSKISTFLGGNVDSLYRIASADPRVARRIVSCANTEDQSYLLGIPIAEIGAPDETQSNIAVYRYHVPSKSWSKHFYRNNAYPGNIADPGDPSTNTGAFNIAAMCTFKQSRFQPESPARNYIERMVVAMGEVKDCIGIERRDGTAIDYCDMQVSLPALSSWTPATGTMVFASPLAASVVPGSVLWLHIKSAGYTDRTYRATIASVSSATVVLEPVVNQAAYTTWPNLAAILSTYYVSILLPITSSAQYMPQAAGQGFEADHASEVLVEFGSRGRFSVATLSFQTDKNDTAGSALINGLAYKEWSDWIIRAEDTQTELRTVRAYFPKENARGTQFRVTVGHSRAWEVFDVSGRAIIMTDPSHKVRRTL